MTKHTDLESYTDNNSISDSYITVESKHYNEHFPLPIKEQDETIENLNDTLKRELSLNDALLIQEYNKTHQSDEENPLERQQTILEKVYTNAATGEVELPPDGGYGWVCMVCVSTIQFSTWGNNSGFGVFLAYYLDNDVFPGATSMDFAWIAGLIVFMAQMFAPVSMIAVKMIGFKTTMLIGCIFHFAAYILASFATKIWHLYVCQGVIVGICYSFITIPALSTIPGWFLRKRGIASGVVMAGTGLGGVYYSLTINAIIKKTGNQSWSLRMIAIFSTVCIITSIIFLRRRNEIPRQKLNMANIKENVKGMISMKVIKTTRIWSVSAWFAVIMFCYTTIVFTYASFATSMGLTAKQASVLTAVINAAQCFGRPSMGFIADLVFGRVNYSMMLNTAIFVIIFAFWMNAKSFAALLICAICFGLTMGVGNVMGQVLVADAFEPEEFIPAWCMQNFLMGFLIVFVEVIALSLRDETLKNPYYYTQIFSGCVCVLCIFLLAPLREWHIKRILTRARERYIKELNVLKEEGKATSKKDTGDEKNTHHEEELHASIKKLDTLLSTSVIAYIRRLFYFGKV